MAILEIVLLLLGGFFIGAIDSVVGSGSLLMVALLSFLGVPTMSNIATMRLTTVFQELAGTATYAKQKLISWKQSLILAAIATTGSYLGAHLVLEVNRNLLSKIVGFIMLFLLFLISKTDVEKKIHFFKKLWNKYFNGGPKLAYKQERFILLGIFTFFLGIYGGFYGGSIGTMLLMLLLLLGNSPLLVSAAAAKLITLALSVSASFVFITNGKSLIDWQLLVPLAWSTVLGSYVGVKKAKDVPPRYLKIVLYLVVLISAVKLIFF